MRPSRDLAERLAVFVDAGLLPIIPTRWQIVQGEIEMTPYVTSTDATAEEGYRRHLISHPLIRQLLILSHVGPDHLITGTALGAHLDSLCAHLVLTFHRGMPVFDLQVIQTHPGGLDRLRAAVQDVVAAGRPGAASAAATPTGRRRWAIASRLLLDPAGYLARFLGDDGWIARAQRFDYAEPDGEGSEFPPEFFSLVGLLRHCAERFPATPGAMGWPRVPGHLLALATRRFREGRGMGWFASGRGRA